MRARMTRRNSSSSPWDRVNPLRRHAVQHNPAAKGTRPIDNVADQGVHRNIRVRVEFTVRPFGSTN
jgi:hypothetical protein